MRVSGVVAMRCSSCGAENPESKKFCGDCGKPLPSHPEQQFRMCMKCGRSISWDSNMCPYCGDHAPTMKMGPSGPMRKP